MRRLPGTDRGYDRWVGRGAEGLPVGRHVRAFSAVGDGVRSSDPRGTMRAVTEDTYLHWPPGFRRQPDGGWIDDDGAAVTDAATLARLRALVLPPAWQHVWVAPDPQAEIQARGIDSRGRVQYRYSVEHTELAARNRFHDMLRFAAGLPDLRADVAMQLRRRPAEPDAGQLTALAVRMLDLGLFRVGHERYVRDDHTYGLTTLTTDQVKVHDRQIRFDFIGKEHIRQIHSVTDPHAARIMNRQLAVRSADPTGHLFVIGADGSRINSATVNTYLHSVGGAAASAKVFRTWGGTMIAASIMGGATLPGGRPHRDPASTAFDAAASVLGNTPAMARSSYVDPAALDIGGSADIRSAVAAAAQRAGTDHVDRVFTDPELQETVRTALAGR